MFYSTDNIVGHKMSLRKLFQRVEIIPRIYSNHKSMKQKIKDRKKICRRTNVDTKHATTKKKSMNKSKRTSENTYRQMKMEIQPCIIYGMQQK